MPSKHQWEKWVHKAWFYTKVLFAILILMVGSYFYGTYSPNKTAIAEVNAELDVFYMNKIEEMDLQEPEFTYINDTQFIRAMHKCINYINFTTPKHLRVPYEMIIGQAALESGWGTSRFATEGNNLFGIRTWDKDDNWLLPIPWTEWPGWGVKVFETKCDSVAYYIKIINEVYAYAEFREVRAIILNEGRHPTGLDLAPTLTKYASRPNYVELIAELIEYNIRGVYEL